MPRFTTIEPDQAQGKAADLLAAVQKKMGFAPNLMKTMAHSPAVLEAFLGFGQALGGGSLTASLREQIAVTVAAVNDCEYCASGHTALGIKLGVDSEELSRNLEGDSDDPKTQAVLTFAREIVTHRGWVGDEDVEAIREAGYSDGEIMEIIATVVINIFTNYIIHIAQADLDFPLVKLPEPTAA